MTRILAAALVALIALGQPVSLGAQAESVGIIAGTIAGPSGPIAGVTVNGSTVRADLDANQRFYGKRLSGADLVLNGGPVEASTPVPEWLQTLSRFIPR